MLTDRRARVIAADWHGGQASPLYALASTGATTSRHRGIDRDHSDVIAEILTALDDVVQRAKATPAAAADEARELMALAHYVEAVGDRGPVTDWSPAS